MIFVTVGTWHCGFDWLIKTLDQSAKTKEQCTVTIAQIGHGRYQPINFKFIKFCSPDKYEQYIKESKIVVTHAGVGSIMTAVLNEKPVIVVPRRMKYGEADNDHQIRTAEQFEKEGLVLVAYSEDSLNDRIKEAIKLRPNVNVGESNEIVKVVSDYIQDIVNS